MFLKIRYWIPIAVAIFLLCGLVYGTVQQNFRQSANDPQIQIAEDLSEELVNGKDPQLLVSENKIDISKSLAPFVIIFDNLGKPIVSSGELDGKIPTPPSGVFNFVQQYGEDRFTWQPRDDVRDATVVRKFNGKNPGFILASRSLREVEKREQRLELQIGLALIVTLVSTLIASLIFIPGKK